MNSSTSGSLEHIVVRSSMTQAFVRYLRAGWLAIVPVLAFAVLFGATPLRNAHAATPHVSPAMLPPASANAPAVPLTAHMEVLLDPSGEFTIEDVAGPDAAGGKGSRAFVPLADGLPHEYSGALWLRLNMLPNTGARNGKSVEYRLDLGPDLAGETLLFVPGQGNNAAAPAFVSGVFSSGEVLFDVSGADPGALSVYMRLSGLPGLWFHPTIEPVAKDSPLLPLDLALAALLTAGLLMGLLRFALDRASWRFWGTLLAGLALYLHFFPSLAPALPPSDPASAARLALSLMAPGIMLMVLPHAGRQLLRIPHTAPGADILFRVYPLIGAALALFPLIPGMGWAARYLPLWPVLLVPLFFVAAHCLMRQIPGALSFLALTSLPLLGTAGSCFELFSGATPVLGSQGHIWGVGLGALVLALTPDTDHREGEEKETGLLERYAEEAVSHKRVPEPGGSAPASDPAGSMGRTIPLPLALEEFPPDPEAAGTMPHGTPGAFDEKDEELTSILAARAVFDERGRVPAENALPSGDAASALSGETLVLSDAPGAPDTFGASDAPGAPDAPDAPDALDAPGGTVVPDTPGRPDAPDTPDAIPDTISMREDAFVGADPASVPAGESVKDDVIPAFLPFPGDAEEKMPEPETYAGSSGITLISPEEEPVADAAMEHENGYVVFDLPVLVREVYEECAERAEEKGLAASWFISPYLGRLYEGDAAGLETVLRLLLTDVSDKLDKGSFSLSVRRAPGESVSGHLLFALEIWSPVHPDGFTDATLPLGADAITRAWAFSGLRQGTFSLEHSAKGSVNLAFSARFASVGEGTATPDSRPVFSHGAQLAQNTRRETTAEESAFSSPPSDGGPEKALSDPLRKTPRADENDGGLRIITGVDAMPDFPAEPVAFDASGISGRDAQPLPEDAHDANRIIVTDMAAGGRRNYVSQLRPLGREILEAREGHECVRLFARHPSGLVLFDADMPESDIAAAVAGIRRLEDERDLPRTALLALTSHEMQSKRMLAAGNSECLIKPVSPQELRDAVERLAPAAKSAAHPSGQPETRQEAAVSEEEDACGPMAGSDKPLPGALPSAHSNTVPDGNGERLLENETAGPRAAATPMTHGDSAEESVQPGAPAVSVTTGPRGAGQRIVVKNARKKKPGVVVTLASPDRAPSSSSSPVPPAPILSGEAEPEAFLREPDAEERDAGSFSLAGLKAEDIVPEAAATPSVFPGARPGETPEAETGVERPEEKDERAGEEVQGICETGLLDGLAAVCADTALERERKEDAPQGRELPLLDLIIPEEIAENNASGPDTDGDGDVFAAETGVAHPQAVGDCIPLPGENDSVNVEMLPFIPGMLYEMDDALRDARRGIAEKSSLIVQEASKRLADKSAAFNLKILERVARCVERAAAADDLEAVGDLFAELEQLAQRYKEALQRCRHGVSW